MRISHATMLALSVSFLAFPAAAQESKAPAVEPLPGEEVIVTGTRAANRTVADSPVPVDVISSQALTTGGSGETNTVLNALVPSFNFPRPSIADASDVIRPATLRGLSPDQTLVLVNGKRRHTSALLNINGTVGRGSAAVDLNTISNLAIDRIEVLRDGAASQYGSDAIAGVINIRLKTADHGGKASVTYGKYVTRLDGVREVLGLQTDAAGQPFFDPANPEFLAANLGGSPSRSDGDTWTLGMNLGVPIGQGFINVTGEYRDRDTVNRAGYDLRQNYNLVDGAFDARELTFNRLNFQYGDPKTEDWNVAVNAGMPLGANWEAYAFGTFSQRNGRSAANWRLQGSRRNRDYSVLRPSEAPSEGNFAPIYANGFLPFIASDYTDYSMAIGVRGEVGQWSVDLSGVYGRNRIDYRTENSINVSFGPTAPRNTDSGGLRFGQFTANLDVTREFAVGFAKPLTLAFGGEYRRENFQERPGQLESYAAGPYTLPARATTAAECAAADGVYAAATGLCSFPGRSAPVGQQGFEGIPAFAKVSASRNSFAGYLELDTDPFRGFTVTAAGRFERYSDFGSTANGKLALRYEFIPQLALRGAISNGFRAPSLHQQYFGATSTFLSSAAGLVNVVTTRVDSPVARALGAQPLKPEKSRNISAGIALNPFRGFSLTADFFHIRIRDRIVLTENLGFEGTGTDEQKEAIKAILDANGFNSVGAARFFINGLDTTTKGVDVVGSYQFDAGGAGRWSLSAAYNYTSNRIDKRLNNLGPLAAVPGLVLFGRQEGLRFEKGQPRDKIVLSANGEIGVFGLTARTTRYGKVVAVAEAEPLDEPTSLTAYGPDDIFLQPRWLTDVEVRYTFKKHMTFSLGADNVFDVYPTRSPTGRRPDGGFYPEENSFLPYIDFSPFGFNGRYVYARFTAQF